MDRILPALLVLVALVLTNGVALALVFSRGLGFLVGPWGALSQLPFVLVLAGAVVAILGRFRRFDRSALGLSHRPALGSAGLWLATGVLLPLTVALGLVAVGVGGFDPRGEGGATRPVTGTLSFAVNAAFQQLGLLGLALAVSPGTRLSNVSVVVASTLFAATHFAPGVTPVYLANVFLFGVACALLFREGPVPSWLPPIAFHAGTNVTMGLVAGGPPTLEVPSLLGWRGLDTVWSGGVAGLESGLALLVAHAVLVGGLAYRETRREVR